MNQQKPADQRTTQLLLEVLDEHARQAKAQGVPRLAYAVTVALHAADSFNKARIRRDRE